ncbi:hypothetical protein H0H92_011653 [Tricholoma furcatifolium]|nr:hypothetical protein H0H92_011653 [Tricholoma furcatifolium]
MSFATRKPKQTVYVDVPPSPYPTALSSSRQLGPKHPPLQPFNGDAPRSLSDTPFLKRKTSETTTLLTQPSPTKKQKVAETSSATLLQNEPNAFVYCHQCSRKCDTSRAIQCTSAHTIKGVEKQCKIKMCIACLKNRYGEDVHQIKASSSNGAQNFKKVSTHKSGVTQSPKSLPKNKVEVLITTAPPNGSSRKSSTATTSKKPEVAKRTPVPAKPLTQTKAGAKLMQQTLKQLLPETLPVVNWNEVSTNLSLRDAEARLQIREFVLRFASVMQPAIPRSQLTELDNLGFGSDNDDEMVPWVSEACVRSMILGLLGMLATLEGDTQKPVKSAIRELRATGNLLTKIWPILSRLRDDGSQLSFPDPLPPPASGTVYNTRTTRSEGSSNGGQPSIIIGHSAQFIPVMEALVEAAFNTPIVREELDNGFSKAKEMTRDVQKAIKEENERWDEERKTLETQRENLDKEKGKGKGKAKAPSEVRKLSALLFELGTHHFHQLKVRREVHKDRMRDIEHTSKLVGPMFAPRFTPLGTDSLGRVFWALSPGASERKAARDFIATVTNAKKVTPKIHIANDNTLTDWTWFVAVWGKKIATAGTNAGVGDEDDDVQWWAFTDPAEIRRVADWIRIDAGIDSHGEADANKPLSVLVKRLNEYAGLLDWRRKEDRYASVIA